MNGAFILLFDFYLVTWFILDNVFLAFRNKKKGLKRGKVKNDKWRKERKENKDETQKKRKKYKRKDEEKK